MQVNFYGEFGEIIHYFFEIYTHHKKLNSSKIKIRDAEKFVNKTFSAMTIATGETKNFHIPLGNMELINGSLEIEIWLRKGDEPLFCMWNGDVDGFSSSKAVTLYLLEYNQWRTHQ